MKPTTASNAELLRQLAAIRGLHAVSWWPLAVGWWVVLAMGLCAIVAVIVISLRRRAWRRSWQGAAARQLTDLETQLTGQTAQASAAQLSLILRRIALRKFARAECAGLEGCRWLRWLTAHDPRGFDWATAGRLLIDAPYAPSLSLDPATLRPLLHAARRWVR